MTALASLIEHWRLYAPTLPDFVHRRDKTFIGAAPRSVHTDVQAYPYVGDLAKADIWLLMLNSKLGHNDRAEEAAEPYRTLFAKNLRQDLEDVEFPLLSIHPELEGTGTYNYYHDERGLGRLIQNFAEVASINIIDAQRVCAQRIAILELLPYRSSEFPAQFGQLPSVNLARRAALEASRSKLLIVPWALNRWGLARSANVLNTPARNFTFAPTGSAGYGKAMLERLRA